MAGGEPVTIEQAGDHIVRGDQHQLRTAATRSCDVLLRCPRRRLDRCSSVWMSPPANEKNDLAGFGIDIGDDPQIRVRTMRV